MAVHSYLGIAGRSQINEPVRGDHQRAALRLHSANGRRAVTVAGDRQIGSWTGTGTPLCARPGLGVRLAWNRQ